MWSCSQCMLVEFLIICHEVSINCNLSIHESRTKAAELSEVHISSQNIFRFYKPFWNTYSTITSVCLSIYST
jgi:hypothetical protein